MILVSSVDKALLFNTDTQTLPLFSKPISGGQGQIKRGVQRRQLPRAPASRGHPLMKFICFK